MNLRFAVRQVQRCVWVVAATLVIGCSAMQQPGHRVESPPPPDSLLLDLRAAATAEDYERAEAIAQDFINAYPNSAALDEVYLVAARASLDRTGYEQAVKYAAVVPERYPVSPHAEEALLVLAEANAALGRHYESAEALCRLLSSPLDADMEARALEKLRELTSEALAVEEIERVIDNCPSTALSGEMTLAMARREFARGNYDRSYELLAELLYEFPQHRRAPEIRQLLNLSASRRERPDHTLELVEPYKLGVLLPHTGKQSRFGRYFEQGVEIAVDEYNAASENKVSFVRADSRGNPVDAIKGVRRLIIEEGVVAVLGAVFTVPSIAAAIECNAWKVPMLSPVASEERIDEIGTWAFQTKVPSEVEVSAVAQLAVEGLLLERFAVLAPDSPEKQGLVEFFIEEITHRGGTIVAEQYYRVGDTDFKAQLEVIRESAPEALFIPGDPEELQYILPQVSFYDMRVQLLGLSNWNSERLLRLSQRELEGALFPRESFRAKDQAAHQQFLATYEGRFGTEPHPVSEAGYFGMRLMLQGLGSGVLDREGMREYLTTRLQTSPAERMQEAQNLAILKVSAGRVREFTALRKPR